MTPAGAEQAIAAGSSAAAAECSPPSPAPGALRRRAVNGTLWTAGSHVAANAIRLGGNLALTRLLFPEAFGVMAIVNVFIQGLWLFTDVGIGPAIVQSPRGDDQRFLDTAFTLQVVRGLALCTACALLAAPVASFYRTTEPLAAQLVWFLPVAGLGAAIDGAASSRIARYRRHLRLKQVAMLDVGSQALAMVVMIAWAWLSPSIWALVAGGLAKASFHTLGSHLFLEGERDRLRWERDAGRALFEFGKWVFASTILTFLAAQADRLILGKLVSWDLLGVYGIAVTLAMAPTTMLSRLGHAVVFPVLSRLRDRGEARLRKAAAEARLPLFLGGGALIAALLPAGPALVETLYDERYAEAGWMLRLLLVGGWMRCLGAPNEATLLAFGHTHAIAAGNAARLLAIVGLLPLGFASHGFTGAVLGLVAADALRYATTTLFVRRLGLGGLRYDLGLSALLALSTVLGYLAVGLAESALAPPAARAAVGMGVGALPWAAPAWRWWRRRAAAGRASA